MDGNVRPVSQRISTKRRKDDHGHASRYAEVASLEELRARVRRAKSTRASLQADIARIRTAPTREDAAAARTSSRALEKGRNDGSTDASLSIVLSGLSQRALEAEEKSMLYRTSAWTVFEIDLDVGRRERRSRKEQAGRMDTTRHAPAETSEENRARDKAGLGLGVRLDTFWRGRFYEPYYLVFAKSQQSLDGLPDVSGGIHGAAPRSVNEAEHAEHASASILSSDGASDGSSGDTARKPLEHVRLLRHTIPHFVPLQSLVRQYLGQRGLVRPIKSGGLDLLDGLLDRNGLWTFLGHLHSHLQAFVARREQTLAIGRIALPAERPSKLIAHGNDAFDQLSIRWALPTPTEADIFALQSSDEVLRHIPGLDDAERLREPPPKAGDERLVVRIHVRFAAPTATHLGSQMQLDANETSDGDDRLGALRALIKNPDELDVENGLVCTHGTVLVEIVRNVVPVPKRAGAAASTLLHDTGKGAESLTDATQYGLVNRKRVWEVSFVERDIDRATDEVLVQAWKEELGQYEIIDTDVAGNGPTEDVSARNELDINLQM